MLQVDTILYTASCQPITSKLTKSKIHDMNLSNESKRKTRSEKNCTQVEKVNIYQRNFSMNSCSLASPAVPRDEYLLNVCFPLKLTYSPIQDACNTHCRCQSDFATKKYWIRRKLNWLPLRFEFKSDMWSLKTGVSENYLTNLTEVELTQVFQVGTKSLIASAF